MYAPEHRAAKCRDRDNCTGPGCNVRTGKTHRKLHRGPATLIPAGLARRIKLYAEHGKNPNAGLNPSNAHARGHDMHKPGSQRKGHPAGLNLRAKNASARKQRADRRAARKLAKV